MQTLRLENGKQRKLDQPIKQLLPNNMKFSDTSDSNNDFELGWYWYDSSDSLDNEYSDFSKEKKGDKKVKSDEDKLITSVFLAALR